MNEITTDNQANVANRTAAKRASRRLWRWLFVGAILIAAAAVGAYGYRIRRHAQLILELKEYYGHVQTSAVHSTWLDRMLDKLIAGHEEYFCRIDTLDDPRDNRKMPAELISRVARDGFESLVSIELVDPQLTPQAAYSLGQMKRLSSLEIRFTDDSPTPVSADVLSGLAKSNSLGSVWISNAALPPETFTILSGMRSVRELHLVFCDVSLDDLATLEKLPHLQSLSLWVDDVNDERLLAFGQLAGLKEFSIWSPNVTHDLTVFDQFRWRIPNCVFNIQMGVSEEAELEPWDNAQEPQGDYLR